MWRDDASLLDMLLWARRAVGYTSDVSEVAFRDDSLVQDATIRCVQLVGEAAARVSGETRGAHPEVAWSTIIGIRNRLVHQYGRVDLSTLWVTATQDCVRLVGQLEPLVPSEPGDAPEEWEFL